MSNTTLQNQELFQISETEVNGIMTKTVSARDLHLFLDVGRKFSTWIKDRIEKYEFVENQDFIIISQNRETIDKNGHNKVSVAIEYYITLDMAKELSMVENNEQGRSARRYFIECEKQLKKVSLTPKQECFLEIAEAASQQAILLALNKLNNTVIIPLENKVKEQTELLNQTLPKAAYHDIVMNCPDLMTVTQIGKDFGLTAQKLNKILHEEKVQYKDKTGVWMVYAGYLTNNYAQTCTNVYKDKEGVDHARLHLKWTQKGRLFIYELLKTKGIIPIVERDDYVPPPMPDEEE